MILWLRAVLHRLAGRKPPDAGAAEREIRLFLAVLAMLARGGMARGPETRP